MYCIDVCAGNDNIHLMTYDTRRLLRIDLRDWEGNYRYADYDQFKVENEANSYLLSSLGKYYGTAGQYAIKDNC